jgi:predicted component of type VI protein secretion system
MNSKQKEVLGTFDSAYKKVQDAFDAAADTMSDKDTQVMTAAGAELRKCGDALYTLFDGLKKPVWVSGKKWYADRMINEIDVNFR